MCGGKCGVVYPVTPNPALGRRCRTFGFFHLRLFGFSAQDIREKSWALKPWNVQVVVSTRRRRGTDLVNASLVSEMMLTNGTMAPVRHVGRDARMTVMKLQWKLTADTSLWTCEMKL